MQVKQRFILVTCVIYMPIMLAIADTGKAESLAAVTVDTVDSDLAKEQAIETLYQQSCAACHAHGVSGAPKTGDVAAWQGRLADKGLQGLVASAVNGVPNTAMVPKGFCSRCTEKQFAALIKWMSSKR